jgi:hypothetical protein
MNLYDLGDGRVQAQCRRCMRQSPVVGLPIAPALVSLANLGWTDEGEALVCPICTSRKTARFRDR